MKEQLSTIEHHLENVLRLGSVVVAQFLGEVSKIGVSTPYDESYEGYMRLER